MRRTLGHIPDRRFGHIPQNMFPVLDERKLLERYNQFWAAYSIRLLTNVYNGNCLRVRRSSDNTEQDIGFNGAGWIDENALTSFVGANNGFVVTWYDQSGNGRNLTRSSATPTEQPRIVNAGTIDKYEGFTGILFDGTNDSLRNTTSLITETPLMINLVSVKTNSANGAYNTIVGFSAIGNNLNSISSHLFNDTATSGQARSWLYSTGITILSTGGIVVNNQSVTGGLFVSPTEFYSLNQGQKSGLGSLADPVGINNFSIGALIRTSTIWSAGAFSELIIHNFADEEIYTAISDDQVKTYRS
jgi:hypothetical protein